MEDIKMSLPSEGVQHIQLREEVFQLQKELVEVGTILIRKVVVNEEKTITVPVRREEIIIEHRSVSPDSSKQPVDQQDGTLIEPGESKSICIPLYTEQILIEKHPVVTEEVLVSKRIIQDVRRFTDTLRHEEAYVEKEGHVVLHGDSKEERQPSHEKETDEENRQ